MAREHFEAVLPQVQAAPAPGAEPAKAHGELRVISAAVLDVRVPTPRIAPVPALSEAPPSIEFSWAGETARHVGTVTHRWLQRIAADGVEQWSAPRVAALATAIARDLARRGIPPGERDGACARVLRAIEGTIGDERGRWLLQSRESARSEYRLRLAGPEGVRLVVIDRTFVDAEGRRWIVDYKTSLHEGGEPEAFLDREMERYREQLAGYAAAFPGEDVALGLYFPLMRGWRVLAS